MRRMTGSTLTPDVPKGPATITGYTTTVVALVAMLLAYIFPTGDEQTLGVIASGVVALGALVVTSLGRQRQAVEQIRQKGAVAFAEAEKSQPVMVDRRVIADDEGPQPDVSALREMLASGQPYVVKVEGGSLERDLRQKDLASTQEYPLPPETEGIDPDYDGRDGTIETRLALEQREACQ